MQTEILVVQFGDESIDEKTNITADVVAGVLILTVTYAYVRMGLLPVGILGGSGFVTLLFWYRTYLKKPTEPTIILSLFLITVAGFEVHLIEEYLAHYAPAISRLFNIAWTERSFVLISFVLAAVLTLTVIGLYYREPLAGFVALFFIVSRMAEFGLFVFPFIRPALHLKRHLRSRSLSRPECLSLRCRITIIP